MESGKPPPQPQCEEISHGQPGIITPQHLQSLELARPLSNAYPAYFISKSIPLLQQNNFEKYSSVPLTLYTLSPAFGVYGYYFGLQIHLGFFLQVFSEPSF